MPLFSIRKILKQLILKQHISLPTSINVDFLQQDILLIIFHDILIWFVLKSFQQLVVAIKSTFFHV